MGETLTSAVPTPGASSMPHELKSRDHALGLVPKQDSPRSEGGQAGDVSPYPGQGVGGGSTLSTSTRELFEPGRPRYPRKDLLQHLGSIFLSHFKPNFFPWMSSDELKQGFDAGTLPALVANAICAVAARFSPRNELRRGPIKR